MEIMLGSKDAVYNLFKLDALTNKREFQPGYPNANGIASTWCLHFVYFGAKETGFDPSLMVNPKGIGYTNANDSYINARRHKIGRKIEFISWIDAQKAANNGDFVVISAFNISGGHGHVAVVRPHAGTFSDQTGVRLVQCGEECGVFWQSQIFNYLELSEPVFYKLPRRK